MSRTASGDDKVLASARAAIAGAQTVEQLRQAQAVVLPLDYGLSVAHERGTGAGVFGPLFGASRQWRCARRRPDQGRTRQAPGARGSPGIRQDWAQGKAIWLMFQDEARFGRISHMRRCWAPKPLRPICQAMLTHEYTYAYGAVDVCTGQFDSLILPHVNTDCMQLLLDEVSARHPGDHIVMVIDAAGWHRSDALKAPANIYLLKLPSYAPELNPIEHVWDELREKFFHNRVFQSLDALQDSPSTVACIVSWPWIVGAILTSFIN